MSKESIDEEKAEELIMEISCSVSGIGKAKAGAVAVAFDGDLGEFRKSDKQRFEGIKNGKNSRLLSDQQIGELIKKGGEISSDDPVVAWLTYLGKGFIRKSSDAVNNLSLDSFDFNPFLIKALDITKPRDIIAFNTYQTITRSIVTSWGTLVEDLLARCGDASKFAKGGAGRSGRNPDIVKKDGDVDVFIQVKSGPNTMNVDMINSLNEIVKEYEKKPKTKFLLGMTYGTRKQISPQIRGNLNDFDNRTLIGRELWDFISGEKGFYKKLFNILDEASAGVMDDSLTQLIEKKINELEKEWETKFDGKKIDEILGEYV